MRNTQISPPSLPQRIGIIGDVHAEHLGLANAIEHLLHEGADLLICTGDIADGAGCLERCVELLQTYDVITVRGNHDRWLIESKVRHLEDAHQLDDLSPTCIDYLSSLPSQLSIPTPLGPLLLCHGIASNDLQKIWPGTERMPIERSSTLDSIVADGHVRFIVNGHVHYRTLIHFEHTLLLNAGTLKRAHKAGFSLLDLDRLEITGFEFEPNIHQVKTLSIQAQASTEIFENTKSFNGQWQPVTLYA